MIRSLKRLFKNLYKEIIIKIFILFYPRPKLSNKKFKDKSVEEYRISIEGNNYQIFKFIDGRIFTNTNDTTAYISKNNFLSKASMQYYKFDNINSFNGTMSKNETLSYGTPKIRKKIKGNILSLLSGGAAKDNFLIGLQISFQESKFFR